jgi:hypothetical protein
MAAPLTATRAAAGVFATRVNRTRRIPSR